MSEVCPFCSPPRVFQDFTLSRALWDAFPVSPGHALLLPKRHIPTWFDATPQEQAELTHNIAVVRDHILREYNPDGFNIGINSGEAAGQTVFHLHIHIIPRYHGDVRDPRGGVRHVIPHKANYLARRQALPGDLHQRPLVRGYQAGDPLLPHLVANLAHARDADIAVAFVLASGVERVGPHLVDLLARGGRLRLLTGDYLDVTDPRALLRLLDLCQAPGLTGQAELRVFETAHTDRSFHPKAYVFRSGDSGAVAYVGSSNLSRSALERGVEWNFRAVADGEVGDVHAAFEELFHHEATRPLTAEWVDGYRARRRPPSRGSRVIELAPESEPPPPPPEPHKVQREALAALEETRRAGHTRGLVVLATGLGKTWLSAFDSDRPEYGRVLFVAHREEILGQALETYRRIRPDARLGRYTGTAKHPDADVLFASIQTLSRVEHLEVFAPDAFDYIVVDEFHHASARTYRRLLDHFEPRFLLGLTATPERTDGGDLLGLCQENLVFRCDLVEGIRQDLLSPFHYYGVPDEVNYENIPWRSSRFDEEELTTAVATRTRAQNAFEQWEERGGARTLAFCVSRRHADFMADYFREAGAKAAAVHSGESSAPRAATLEALEEGTLQVVFAVDMFNEGVDVPSIDTVIMLRPTESRILWLQQFGRGLRKAEDKRHLTVIDYIGNHRTFLLKPQALLQLDPGDHHVERALTLLAKGELELPPGCEVTYDLEAIDILRGLLRIPKGTQALRTWYEQYTELHDRRPTALEAFHEGYSPRSARKLFGSWLRFVETMDDLTREETRACRHIEPLLDALEVTPMTRSYKMVLLSALLNEGALPGEIPIDRLTRAFARVAGRSPHLTADVTAALDDDDALRRLLEENPIAAWTEGKGTGGRSYFAYEDGVFRTTFDAPAGARDAVQELVRELVDWRLGEYLYKRLEASHPHRAVLKVIHAGQRPILNLDRNEQPSIPEGWTPVTIDGDTYEANFAKVAVNVLRREGHDKNELPNVLRRWFGPDAGLPGTRYMVACEPAGGGYRLTPLNRRPGGDAALLWKRYTRDEMPRLFGIVGTDGKMPTMSGFVQKPGHTFLLVTLDKKGMQKQHQYADRFLSPEIFEWQSQNQTRQDTPSGQKLRHHAEKGIKVHLFVRRSGKIDGRAAPFVYCGDVRFLEWEGEKPITVRWALREAVPEALWEELRVPGGEPVGYES